MAQYPLDNLLHSEESDSLQTGQPTGAQPLPPSGPVQTIAPSGSANILQQITDANPPDFESDDFRNLGDVEQARKAIFNRALRAASEFKPISNNRYTLSLTNVKYTGPDKITKADHKKAIMQNTYLSRKMYGDWVLTDNATGKEVGHRRAVIAHIPYLTPLGTFAKNGNDYVMSHQLRLRPGIYTRWQDNGELEAHVNATGGMGHRIYMEPETGLFKIKFQQSSLPAADVLKILGASAEQMQEAWGRELYQANMGKTDPKTLNKLYAKLTHGKGKADNPEDKIKEIREAFSKLQLDPEVSQITLGKPYSSVSSETILDTTRKLVDINKGLRDTDSRDNTTFQSVWGPEDLIAEKLADGNKILRKYLWKVSTNGDLSKIPGGVFDKGVDSALIGSGLGMPIEEINPIEIMDGQYRVTRMGEGGIASLTAVPDSARNVHPSQLGFIDVLRTPESMKVGVDARFVNTLKKGADKKIYTPVLLPNGKKTWKSAQEVNNAVVAFPGEMKGNNEFVAALVHGEMRMVPREEVDYSIPTMQNTIHATGAMVPLMSAVKGQRAVMASRMLTQALPVENPEAPLVQNGIIDEDDMSYEERYGNNLGAIHAKEGGRVLSVDKDKIVIRKPDGMKEQVELYNDFIFNRKTGLTQTPLVQPGDIIEPGQLLARSNYTDDKGASAVGLNARVAFLPFQGKNWEDGFVVSESFAKRATSTHYYKNKLPITDNTITGKQKFISLRPGVYTKEQLSKFDDNGVIQPGMEVKTGDPLILAVSKNEPTEAQKAKGRRTSYKDASVTWDHHDTGVVTDVFSSPKGTQVIVKAKSQLQVADKLSGRQGNKGVVAAIVPDSELPTLPNGEKPEILISPLSLVSRVNPAMVLEAQLGKVAKLTGKRYSIKDFDSIEDLTEFVNKELEAHGLTSNEDLTDDTDPDNPKTIPQVLTGNMFFMKLMHTAESKGQSRGVSGYTSDMQPAKGGDDGAKRMGIMELNALLGNGGLNNIVDMKYVKGQENTDYWRQYMAGFNPPTPKIPYVYNKFVNYLKGAGINVVREGPRLQLMAMTNKDIDNLCEGREITGTVDPRTGLNTVSTVAWDDNMKTVKGGLFDEALTGGHNGNKWSFIRMDTKLPNPVMEQPLRLMLGMTEKQFRDVMSGKEQTASGTGPEALYQMASKLDIDSEIEKARMDIASGRKTFRDAAVRKLGYLKTAKRLKQNPADWFTDKCPVLPPYFRPVSQMGENGLPLVSDPNYMYKDLFDTNQAYKYNKKYFGEKESGDLALSLYDSFKAVTGLGDPVTKELQTKQTKGLLKAVFGSNPKFGMVQRQLLSTPVDMSGRGVIAPNPDMDMDTVGIPENLAWDSYKIFVARKLRQHGRTGMQALDEIKNKTKAAREALQEVMSERPVLINRAPTLHKFNMMACHPVLIPGDHIELSPFICRGMNADFDGDSMLTLINLQITDEVLQYYMGFTNKSSNNSVEIVENLTKNEEDIPVISANEKMFLSNVEVSIEDIPVVEGSEKHPREGETVWDVPQGVYVNSIDRETGISTYLPVTKKYKHENLEMYDVTVGPIRSPRVLTVNKEDTMLVYKDGEIVTVPTLESLNHCVPRVITKVEQHHRFATDSIDLGTNVVLTPDVAMLIGAIVGDGWVDNQLGTYLSSIYPYILDTYCTVADNSGIPQASPASVKHYKVKRWGSEDGCRLNFHFKQKAAAKLQEKIGKGAFNKKLPMEILHSSDDVLIGALIGLMDTDGTVSFAQPANGKKAPQKCVKYDTCSPVLRDQIVSLLTRLDIRCSVCPYKSSTSSNTAYNITLSNFDLVRFCKTHKNFKLNHRDKQANLEKIIESFDPSTPISASLDVVPYPTHIAAAFSELCINSRVHVNYRKRGWLPRVAALELVEQLRKMDWKDFTPSTSLPIKYREGKEDVNWDYEVRKWCELVENKELCWEPVTNVTRSSLTTGWDITVPGTLTFATFDGYMMQDCIQFHVPTTKAAVEEAEKKLLPSRNLLSPGDFTAMPIISKDHLTGLNEITRVRPAGSVPTITFATKEDAIRAYRQGKLNPTVRVKILNDKA